MREAVNVYKEPSGVYFILASVLEMDELFCAAVSG